MLDLPSLVAILSACAEFSARNTQVEPVPVIVFAMAPAERPASNANLTSGRSAMAAFSKSLASKVAKDEGVFRPPVD